MKRIIMIALLLFLVILISPEKGSLLLFPLIGFAAINGAEEERTIQAGDSIKVHYKGTLEDGAVFSESKEEEPFEFKVGSGNIIPGFDNAVIGMKLNEEKDISIEPENAYGLKDDSLVRDFPKSSLPQNLTPEIGMVLNMQDNSENTIQALIVKIEEESITVDFNHPLAGRTLSFNIKVIAID